MSLTQICRRRGTVQRVPRGEEPMIELHLEPGQYVVSIEVREAAWVGRERKTVDWAWTAFVVSPLDSLAEQVAEAVSAKQADRMGQL